MPDPNPNPEAASVEKPAETGGEQTPSLVVEDEKPVGTSDQAAEEKPSDQPKEEGKSAEDNKPASVPEEYEIELPEGIEEEAIAPILDEAVPLFKELGLTNEAVQKLVDFEFARQAKQEKVFAEQRQAWYDEVKKDPELGGENLEANMKLAGKAIRGLLGEQLGKEYLDFLKNTGFDNHPKQFRLLVAIGKKISEDTVRGSGTHTESKEDRPLVTRIYENLPVR